MAFFSSDFMDDIKSFWVEGRKKQFSLHTFGRSMNFERKNFSDENH